MDADTMEAKLIQSLTLDMIPEGTYKDIAKEIGIENLIKLSNLLGGTTFYLPKTESFLRPARDAFIKKEFNGYNTYALTQKYNVSFRRIRQICGEEAMDGQQNLFNLLKDS